MAGGTSTGDGEHGAALIDALARHGDGLPANVLPLMVNEVTQVGLETIAAAFAYGASGVRFLLRAKPKHDVDGLRRTIALAEPILAGLGFGGERITNSRLRIADVDLIDAGVGALDVWTVSADGNPARFERSADE